MFNLSSYIAANEKKNAGERWLHTNSPTIQATVNLAEEGRQMTSVLPRASARQFVFLSAIDAEPGISGPDLRKVAARRGVAIKGPAYYEVMRVMIQRRWITRKRHGGCTTYRITSGGQKELASVVSFYTA